MKKNPWIALAALLAAIPVAAQVEVGDLSGFKEALKDAAVPAAPASKVAEEAILRSSSLACPVLDLNGATVGRGLFESDYTVKIAGKEVGKVTTAERGLAYTAGGAMQAVTSAPSNPSGRFTATVVGCEGLIGTIEETDSHDSSRFTVRDASGKELTSGEVDGTTWSLSGAGASATIQNAHPIVDRYALAMSGIDGRLVLMAAVMNNQALYRRAAQRRRENPHEPHGRDL